MVASTPETMVRPSSIRLDLADATLDEALGSFDGALEGRVAWLPDVPTAVRGRRVTVRNARPVPFWTAIDQLARAGDLRTLPGLPAGAGQLPPGPPISGPGLRRPEDSGEALRRLRGTIVVDVGGMGLSEEDRRDEVAFDFADIPLP